MTRSLPAFSRGQGWTQRKTLSALNRLVEAHNASALDGDGIIEVKGCPSGYTLSLNVNILRQRIGRPQGFWAKLGTSTVADGVAQNRWTYDFVEQDKTAAGYDGWADKASGLSGTARNTIEDMNTDAGVEGNGVDVDGGDFPATFDIQPAPSGVIIWMRPVAVADDVEYWFSYENGVDGTCD